MAYIHSETYSKFLLPMMSPTVSIIAVYHTDAPFSRSIFSKSPYFPAPASLLGYFATSIISIHPFDIQTEDDYTDNADTLQQVRQFVYPSNSNITKFLVHLIHRRKSGRSIEADYEISFETHTIQYKPEKKQKETSSGDGSEELLKGLTTFNLTTTENQRIAREKVDLPYLQAQEVGEGGAKGGAIIYEFEKDDDYDEEDPYEDPF